MTDRTLEERGALDVAERKDFKPDEIRYCPKCGRTVVFRENIFNNDSRQGSVFCTCEWYGPPMVPISNPEEDN